VAKNLSDDELQRSFPFEEPISADGGVENPF
jgi:hypothetical protein